MANQVAGQVPQADRLGRGAHRGHPDLLPAAAAASQAHEVDQHAGAPEPELKRRTHVVRIFPSSESCLRLIRALAVETHENWLEGTRYLNMAHLIEHKKEALRQIEQADAA